MTASEHDDPHLLPHATPASLELVRRNVPLVLQELPNWVCGSREPKATADGTVKSSKRPIDPRTGDSASSTDPSTWAMLNEAIDRALRDSSCFGVGINLLDTNLVGLDLDDVLDPATGELLPAARDLLESLPPTYTEVSPSGTGLRLFLRGRLPAAFRGSNVANAFGSGTQLECYDGTRGGRYLAVTGRVFEGRSELAEATDEQLMPLVELQQFVRERGRQNVNRKLHRAGLAKAPPEQEPPAAERARETRHNDDPEHDLVRARWIVCDAKVFDGKLDTYPPWLRLGAACKAFGDEGLQLWIEASRSSPSFDEQEISGKWPGLAGSSKNTFFALCDEADPTWRQRYRDEHGRGEPNGTSAPGSTSTNTAAGGGGVGGRTPPMSPLDVIEKWRKDGPLIHQPTGWETVDKMTRGGFVYGMLNGFVGAPDGSKTLVLKILADRWAQAGVMVAMHCVDEDADGLMSRFLQTRDFRRDDCEQRRDEDLKAMAGAMTEINPLIRFYDASWSIEAAAADLAAVAKAAGTRAAYLVDSLQTVRSIAEGSKDGLREQVTMRTFALKAAAAEHRLIVVFTSEMVRAGYRTQDAEREVNDMALGKESGSIEFQAKFIASVRTAEASEDGIDRVKMKLVKNKVGSKAHEPFDKNDCLMLRLDKDHQTLTEDPDYKALEQPTAKDRKDARTRTQLVGVAAKVAVALTLKPGLIARAVRSAARAPDPKNRKDGRVGSEKADDAVEMLQAAIQLVPGTGKREHHYLDGSKVSAEIMQRIDVADRPKVAASRWPKQGGVL